MSVHQIHLEVAVPADKDVTADMVRDLLSNQLALNPVAEVGNDKGIGGLVHWRQVRVRSLGVR